MKFNQETIDNLTKLKDFALHDHHYGDGGDWDELCNCGAAKHNKEVSRLFMKILGIYETN